MRPCHRMDLPKGCGRRLVVEWARAHDAELQGELVSRAPQRATSINRRLYHHLNARHAPSHRGSAASKATPSMCASRMAPRPMSISPTRSTTATLGGASGQQQPKPQSSMNTGLFRYVPQPRSRTWIYRLGGWWEPQLKRPDFLAVTGDSGLRADLGSGRIWGRFREVWAAE